MIGVGIENGIKPNGFNISQKYTFQIFNRYTSAKMPNFQLIKANMQSSVFFPFVAIYAYF